MGRALVSLALLVALAGALPVALGRASIARFGSPSPLHGVRAPWRWNGTDIAGALGRPLGDDAVVDAMVRAGLVTIWVALAIVLITTIAETAHVVRHRGFTLPDLRGLGWAQRIGRFIAAGLIVIGPLTSLRTSAAPLDLAIVVPVVAARVELVATEAAPAALVLPPVSRPGADVRADDARPSGDADARQHGADRGQPSIDRPDEHVVVRGESVYSIASRLASGEAARTVEIADAILDANPA